MSKVEDDKCKCTYVKIDQDNNNVKGKVRDLFFFLFRFLLEEEDRPITGKNFIKALRTGRFGKRRRPPRKAKPLIKTNTLFIFSPENR